MMKPNIKLSKTIKSIYIYVLSALLVTTSVNVTKVYAEDETSPESSNTAEPSSKNYSDLIQSSVTYSEDKSVATVVISVNTEDDVMIDFSNNDTITEYMESSVSEVNQSEDGKSITLNIVKNGDYTFDTVVLNSGDDVTSDEPIGSKTIDVKIEGLTETEASQDQYEADEAVNVIFTPTIENVNVAYFNWHSESDTTGTINFTDVEDGATKITVSNFKDSSNPGYILFFVTPKDNHLFTGLGAEGAGQAWLVGDYKNPDGSINTDFSTSDYLVEGSGIGNYPGLKNIILAARAKGYIACFGWSRGAATNEETISFELTATEPTMAVQLKLVKSDKADGSVNNLMPGNKLYFQVVATPSTVKNSTVQKVTLTSVQGETVEKELTKQTDGTYTNGTDYIEYVITDEDWLKGRVTFSVDASVSYTCSFKVSSGTVSTTSTVTETTNANAAPNPEYNKDVSLVKYAFVSSDGSTLPDSVTSLLPSDESAELNTTITPTTLDQTKVVVDKGYWEFTSWNPESKISTTQEVITFTGTWKFRQSINPDEDGYGDVNVTDIENVKYNGSSQQQKPVVKDSNNNPLTEGVDYDLSYSDDTTNSGTVTVTITGKGNYSGTVTKTYEITKRNVTLTSETASKPYDGTALTKPNVTTDGDDFVTGEVSDLQATGSVTNVSDGSVTNTITYTKEANYKDTNYNITKNEGTLSIAAKELDPDTAGSTITVNDASDAVYDGTEHKYVPEVKAGDTTLTTDDYTVTYSTTDFTNANGTITVTITGKGNYSGEFTKTYEITKRPISFTGDSGAYTYNGQDQTVSGYSITSTGENTGLVNGHTASVTATATRKDIGTSNGTITVNSITNNGDDVTSNYEISTTAGSITINQQSVNPDDQGYTGITVTAPENVKYNGSSQEQKPVVKDSNNNPLTEDVDYELSYSNDTTNTGKVTVTITGKGNYSGTVTTTYEITQRNVTINASNASKVYGESNPNFTYTFAEGSDSLINNNDLGTITVSRNGTNEAVGTYTNDLTVSYTTNRNYNVTTNPANFVISRQSIIDGDPAYSGVQINNPSNYQYSGETHQWSPTVKATDAAGAPTLAEGIDYTVTYTRGITETTDFTNVGRITVTITGIGNYSGTVTKTYDIIQRNVIINATEASKVYGATNPEFGYTVTSGSIIGTDLGTITVSRTSTNEAVGTYTNDLTVSYTPNNNYFVETHPANFTITQQSINPKRDDGSDDPSYINVSINDPTDVTYDGNEHKFVPEVKAGDTTLTKGTDYTVTYTVTDPTTGRQVETTDFTNVKGEITVTITGQGNYSGTITKTYEINPKPVTITVADKSKVYEQEDPEFTATQEGLVKEDDLGKITAYRTNTDENAGTYREVLDVTYTANTNYTVTVEKGDFEIIPQSISPKDEEGKDDPTYLGVETNDPKDVIYDGKDHKFVPEVTKPDGTKLEEGKDYTVTYTVKDPITGEQVEIDDFTNVNGEITITITGKDNYSGTIIKTYEIKQREIEFVGNSATKVYNGKEQAVDGYTVKLTDDTHGLVSGHIATLAAGASRKDEGTSTGRITAAGEVVIMNGKEDVTKNYKITTTPGSITIKCSGWDDGGPFTTDTCGNVFDRWGNKIYEATSCNVGGYNLVRTSVED